MSANLTTDDLQTVADLIEKLQNVQRAIRDLHDYNADEPNEEIRVNLASGGSREQPVAHTHSLSYWVVLQGLKAMERELLRLLAAKDITVEPVALAEVA